MGEDLPLSSHAAWKDLQEILLSEKKKGVYKYKENNIIYNKIHTHKSNTIKQIFYR